MLRVRILPDVKQWAYIKLVLETRTRPLVQGQLRRSKKRISIPGLNKDHNDDLKGIFKTGASQTHGRAQAIFASPDGRYTREGTWYPTS
jgi:hypothetical protein